MAKALYRRPVDRNQFVAHLHCVAARKVNPSAGENADDFLKPCCNSVCHFKPKRTAFYLLYACIGIVHVNIH